MSQSPKIPSLRRPNIAALDAIGEKYENREAPPAAPPVPTTVVESQMRPPAPAPRIVSTETAPERPAPRAKSVPPTPDAPPVDGKRSVVERRGRVLADGSRRGARTLRRMTVYLPVDLAQALTLRCATHQENISDVVARAVEHYLPAK